VSKALQHWWNRRWFCQYNRIMTVSAEWPPERFSSVVPERGLRPSGMLRGVVGSLLLTSGLLTLEYWTNTLSWNVAINNLRYATSQNSEGFNRTAAGSWNLALCQDIWNTCASVWIPQLLNNSVNNAILFSSVVSHVILFCCFFLKHLMSQHCHNNLSGPIRCPSDYLLLILILYSLTFMSLFSFSWNYSLTANLSRIKTQVSVISWFPRWCHS
jgi:hypothetical protein